MVESPQRIWIEADDECPYFYEAHELHDVEQDVIEYVRADLYAALEAKLAARTGGVKVKALEWQGTNGDWHSAYAEFGGLYRITEYPGMAEPYKLDTHGWWEGLPCGFYKTLEEAKAAAQADYEHRILSALEPAPEAQHTDDKAVDRFAAAMKRKLAQKREEGRGGWDDREQCSAQYLSSLLRDHVEKGDPLDVGNLAMMLHQRGDRISPAPEAQQEPPQAAMEAKE